MFRTHISISAFVLIAALPVSAQVPDILGSAQNFAVLAGSAVTNTGPTVLSGNLGVWPGTAITGFPPGSVVDGAIHSADPVAMQAQSDATTAYNLLAGLPATANLTGQDLGLVGPLLPGVYKFDTSAQLTGTLSLNTLGNPYAVFVFQIGTTLTTASNSSVVTINGPDDCRIYWQVGSSATLGTGTSFQGTIIALASITMNTGANIVHGRALARTGAVTLDDCDITAGCTCILIATSNDCNGNFIPDECDDIATLPHFTICPDSPTATVGVPLTFDICAVSGVGGAPITVTVLGMPVGATLSVPLPVTSTSVCTTFSWTPTPDQATNFPSDAIVLEFFLTDTNGCAALCKMRIPVAITLLLFGPNPGDSQFNLLGHLFSTNLGRLRSARPDTVGSTLSYAYDMLPSHYVAQVVMFHPLGFPQQPGRWSFAVEFTKDPVTQTMQTQQHGTVNGIDLSVVTFTNAQGQRRVKFPFLVQGM